MEVGGCAQCGVSGLGKAGQDESEFTCLECEAAGRKSKKIPKTPQGAFNKMFGGKRRESEKPASASETKKKKMDRQDSAQTSNGDAHGENEEDQPIVSLMQSMKAIENDLACAVCLDLVAKPVTLADCGHTFCFLCLRSTVRKGKENSTAPRCPTCRTIIKHAPSASNCMIEQVVRAVVESKTEPRRSECKMRLAAVEVEVDREYKKCGGWPWESLKHLEPMWDEEDTVFRCPECAWEIDEEGECTNHACSKSFDESAVRVPQAGAPRQGGVPGDESSDDEEDEGPNEWDLNDSFINDAAELSVEEEDPRLDDDGSDSASSTERRKRKRKKERRREKRRAEAERERMAVCCAREEREREEEDAAHGDDESEEEEEAGSRRVQGSSPSESDESGEGSGGRRLLKQRKRMLSERKRRREAAAAKAKQKQAQLTARERKRREAEQGRKARQEQEQAEEDDDDDDEEEDEDEDEDEEEEDDEEDMLARRAMKKRRVAAALESSESGGDEEEEAGAPAEGAVRGQRKQKGRRAVVERQDSKRTLAQKRSQAGLAEEEEEEGPCSPMQGEFSPPAAESEEEEAGLGSDDEPCVVCGSSSDPANTILCDGCDGPHHAACVGLSGVPTGSWYCRNCTTD